VIRRFFNRLGESLTHCDGLIQMAAVYLAQGIGPSSPRRRPGPIRRGDYCERRCSTDFTQPLAAVVMGSGLRRNDEMSKPSLRGALLSAEGRLRAKTDATKQSIASESRGGLLRCDRNDGWTHFRILAASPARGVLPNLPPSPDKGRGECRAPNAPAASRGKIVSTTRVSHHRSTGKPGIPARDGVNGCSVISPVLRACWPPSPARLHASLTPASG
jgi:hypothetical protein